MYCCLCCSDCDACTVICVAVTVMHGRLFCCGDCDACTVVCVACVFAARLLGCEGDGNSGVGSRGGVVAVSVYMGGTRGSGIFSSAGDVLEMSVVRGVGGVCGLGRDIGFLTCICCGGYRKSRLVCVCGFVPTSPAFMSSTSHPAGPHDCLGHKTVIGSSFLGAGGVDTICTGFAIPL